MKATNVFVTILLVSVVLSLLVGVSGATWCNNDYAKRVNVSVNNTAGSALTDYQVYVNLSSNPINETSMRIYNATSCTLQPHWCENITNGNCTKLWINYSVIAASAWTNNTAIYYDNTTASSTSNGTNTFEFFDDFNDYTFDYVQEDVDSDDYANYPGSAVEMPNGSVWMFYSQGDSTYHDWNGDFKIKYRVSADGGLTWGASQVFYDTANRYDGEPIPYREGSTVYLFWTELTGSVGDESNLWMRKTTNNGTTWTDKVKIWGDNGANEKLNTAQNIIKHGSTYIISMYYLYSSSPEEFRAYCINSTNIEGTWTKGADVSVPETRGAMEPTIVELSNGDIYMTIRTKSGHQYKAVSSDDTATWDTIAETTIDSPEARATVLRLSNGHLMMTWNNASSTTQSPRYPLTVGISTDNFTTFDTVKNIKTESGSNQLSNMGNQYELSDGTILFGYGHYYSSTSHLHLDVARFTESDLSCVEGNLSSHGWTTDEATSGAVSVLNNELDIYEYGNYYAHIQRNISITDFVAQVKIKSCTDCGGSWGPMLFAVWDKTAATTDSAHVQNFYDTVSNFNGEYIIDDAQNIIYQDSGAFSTDWFWYRLITDSNNISVAKSSDGSTWDEHGVSRHAQLSGATQLIGFGKGFARYSNDEEYNNNAASAGTRGHCYIDDVLVRKYAATEPSATLGSEEQQGANPILHIGNTINIKEDWGRDFNSNLSANVTVANASDVWMNFTNAEFTNTSLGNLNLTLEEWVNESHNVNAPDTNVSVDVYLNSTTTGATNDTDSFWYEVTKRTNTATMDSPATQNADTSETFYVNATCNEEYSDTFLGAANLLEDGTTIDTDTSVTNYVNFSHSESSIGQYNYTIRFYNLTHYDNATTSTYSNVTVSGGEYPPGTPQNLTNTTGNFWVNHTWSIINGMDNTTDSFNVSVNLTWYNGTTNFYYNNTPLSAHKWSNITVWSFNNSGNGSLGPGSASQNTQIPNNIVNLTVTENYNKLETQTVFISDTASSDADGDTPTYSCNRTDLFATFSTVTGYGNWTTGTTDAGTYYVDIGVSDGWRSTDNKTLTIIITDATPGIPSGLANTTGNFWVNHTWSGGANTDTFNASVNLSWSNSSSNEYYNNTPLSAHKWSNVSVYGFNSTSGETSSGISQNTQIPNNLPVLSGLPDNTTDEDVNQTDIFDLDDYFTDADGDTPTYLVESNNQSAYVSVTINASNNVSYTLASRWNGTASVVINVTDGWGGEDNDTFLIIVNAAPLPGDYTPGNPTGLANTTGNYWINYTWNVGGGNATDSYNVSWNLTWYNGTTTTFMKKEVGASNWANITIYAYNSSGNGSLSTGSVSDNVQAPAYVPGDYIPPNPTTLQNTTGNYYVNFTWSSGGGANITDSYNVSWNTTWYNTTLTAYMQKEVGASNWGNITVYAYNSSGNGSLSANYISDEVQAPAAAPGDYPPATPTTLANTTGNGWVHYTWSSGGANVTDSYNVSWNSTWYNTTLVAYMNDTVGEFGWANITVFAFNSSGNGSLSAGSISDETQADGGTFTTSMATSVYNLITYYGESNSTAEQFGLDIGNVEYIARYNNVTVPFTTHTMGHIDNNFTTIHGWSYFVFVNASGSTTYQRNNIPDTPYNTQLFNRWNTIGWTNSTNTNAEGLATSIGSACKYTSMLNADGVTYTTHTVGFASNNHAVDKGKGYWVWTNTGLSWSRNS